MRLRATSIVLRSRYPREAGGFGNDSEHKNGDGWSDIALDRGGIRCIFTHLSMQHVHIPGSLRIRCRETKRRLLVPLPPLLREVGRL